MKKINTFKEFINLLKNNEDAEAYVFINYYTNDALTSVVHNFDDEKAWQMYKEIVLCPEIFSIPDEIVALYNRNGYEEAKVLYSIKLVNEE